MKIPERLFRDISVLSLGFVFIAGLMVLVVNLKKMQIDEAADYNLQKTRQYYRLVQTASQRGRILDSSGRVIAGNRQAFSIAINPSTFQNKTFSQTAIAITNAIDKASKVIGLEVSKRTASVDTVYRHLKRSLVLPYVIWRDVDAKTLAVFSEHIDMLPGFECVEQWERRYPFGDMACHAIGYVGHGDAESVVGDERMDFREKELAGRSGIELYCDSYLRGVSGERRLIVDAQGFVVKEDILKESRSGPDLKLTIDAPLQIFAERLLRGQKGACVVLNPRTGAVLAMASAPSYNLNSFVPFLSYEVYHSVTNNSAMPLLNRASGCLYPPGSIFKPITAIAALECGIDPEETHFCYGFFELGTMTLRCARRWGHGELNLCQALRDSCNPYFAAAALKIGTNLLAKTARKFGLGSRTGIDFPIDSIGNIPDGQFNKATKEHWYAGELPLTAIGQGKLLVTPLQMAVAAGALGTGLICTPRLNSATPVSLRKLDVSKKKLEYVQKGMRLVVLERGTGSRANNGLNAYVIGKTGTAEIGPRHNRRKNTWFIAYACANEKTLKDIPEEMREVAIAFLIEDGESGSLTAAPKVGEILKKIYN
jgi:penicillin-binding protein 2